MTSKDTDIDIDQIWKDFDKYNNGITLESNQIDSNQIDKILKCSSCDNPNLLETHYETTCNNCGLVLTRDFCSNDFPISNFETIEPIQKKSYPSHQSSKLKKMQEWYMWTNDEKSQYKLSQYTKNLCQKLELLENLYDNICQTVFKVMEAIKKQEGTKRARVKDGIILVCIQYVYHYLNEIMNKPSAIELAKKINLDVKYITKAEKIVLELINKNPNILNKSVILDIKKPMEYVYHVNLKHNLQISNIILDKVNYLIDKCEKNDILLDHTPLSIGVCCLYYILKLNNIEIDLKIFSNIYNLSVVTVMKTYNKLKTNNKFLLDITKA